MNKRPFKLTEQMIKIWKACVIDYLNRTLQRASSGALVTIGELKAALLTDGVLNARYMYKGQYLVQPNFPITEALYLKSGFAKLYTIDPDTGKEILYYVWEPDSVIIMYAAFMEQLPNHKYYIRLLTDCELVSISNFSMTGIYEVHSIAYKLTSKILCDKTERRMQQTTILSMTDKRRRYCVFKKEFPRLDEVLTIKEIGGFINVDESTVRLARSICPE